MTAEPITMDRWGKDHWSLLAYVETRCVDYCQGQGWDGRAVAELDRRHMRTNRDTHPLLDGNGRDWKPANGTRLKGYFASATRHAHEPTAAAQEGVKLLDHDDWDCLDDLSTAGFVDIVSLPNAWVSMTPAGLAMAADLRAHKAAGGQFAEFTPPGFAAQAA